MLDTLGLAAAGTLGSIPLPYGQLVATYTVASLAAPVWRLLVMAATRAGTVFAAVVLLDQAPPVVGVAVLPFVAAYSGGHGRREATPGMAPPVAHHRPGADQPVLVAHPHGPVGRLIARHWVRKPPPSTTSPLACSPPGVTSGSRKSGSGRAVPSTCSPSPAITGWRW